MIEEHPIDLQILGIGTNAHIGFNEPGSSFDSLTRKVQLTKETIEANKRFFESAEEVQFMLILWAWLLLCLLTKFYYWPMGKQSRRCCKCSKWTRNRRRPCKYFTKHKDVVFIVDEDAASKL